MVNSNEELINSITISVIAKVKIDHYYEAKILEALGVKSEVLIPVVKEHHINKWEFKVLFVNGTKNLRNIKRNI